MPGTRGGCARAGPATWAGTLGRGSPTPERSNRPSSPPTTWRLRGRLPREEPRLRPTSAQNARRRREWAPERKATTRLGPPGRTASGREEGREAEEEAQEAAAAAACAAPACAPSGRRATPGCLPRQGRRKMAGRRPPRSQSPSPLPGCSRRPAPASTPPARRPRNEAAPAAREGLCLPQRGAGGGGGRLP